MERFPLLSQEKILEEGDAANPSPASDLNIHAHPHSHQAVPQADAKGVARLLLAWTGAVCAGGITPGMVLFTDLFAEAGMFGDSCGDGEIPCTEQYLLVSTTFNVLQTIVFVALLPAGLLFDTMGGRLTSVAGAGVVVVGVSIVMLSLVTLSPTIFVVGILVVDFGSWTNNAGLWGLLFHLPGWQALVLAMSNGCIQASSMLPVLLKKLMEIWELSLVSAFGLYILMVVFGGLLCWLSIPSQGDYYDQAAKVLGMPIPKAPKISMWSVKRRFVLGAAVLRKDMLSHMMLIFPFALGFTSFFVYTGQLVPFAQALFGTREEGQSLGVFFSQTSAVVGIVGVPLVGILTDVTGLTVLAMQILITIVVLLTFDGYVSWTAQAVCVVAAAWYTNCSQLMITKYVVSLCPPQRIGTVTGLFSTLAVATCFPIIPAFSMSIEALGAARGAARFLIPTDTVAFLAVVGWIALLVKLFHRPAMNIVLLPEDEKDLMGMFFLSKLEDAEQVLDLDRTELLGLLASQDVRDQREILMRSTSKEARSRYMDLAARRSSALANNGLEPISESIEGGQWHVDTFASAEEFAEALFESWTPKDEGRGEPILDWMLEPLAKSDPKRSEMIRSIVDLGAYPGKLMGHMIAIRKEPGGEILGCCVAYPPKVHQDQDLLAMGSPVWFYTMIHSKFAQVMLNFLDWDMRVMDRFVAWRTNDDYIYHTKHRSHCWYISHVGVRQCARGKGLAKKLLDFVWAKAEAEGAACSLECGAVNIPIYEKCGYQKEWQADLIAAGSSSVVYGMTRRH